MRRTYIGVAYGKFDPASPTFTYLLPVSVGVSLIGAGATFFGTEMEGRKGLESVTLCSWYGAVALLLRMAKL